jgi:hypothetical protein
VAAATPSGDKRRWWAIGVLVFGSAAILIRLALAPWTQSLTAVPVVVLTIALAVVAYNRGESKLRAEAGPDVWVHRCIDPAEPQAWLSVVVSDDAVTVLDRKRRVRNRWPLATIADVTVGPVMIGALNHTALTIRLRDRHPGHIALPSRSMFSYPRALADEAQGEIRRRLAQIRA